MASKLLVVIGCLEDEDHIKTIVKDVGAGIDKWMSSLPLDDQEEMIQTLNSIPSMKSIPNRNAEDGTVVSRYRGRILDSTILISPTSESLNDELIDLFLTAPPRCLIAYGGFVTEDNADWVLQDGLFSFDIFQRVLKDSKVISALSEHKTRVTVSCCKLASWKTVEQSVFSESKIALEIMDSQPLHELNAGGDQSSGTQGKKQSKFEGFATFLEDGISNEIGGIFNTLKPPLQEGFLKIRNPCLYIFPGGCGDSTFFAVNGFNMLVNGGSCTKPWFWKLIQHLDRVDSILATHLGCDNLPGLNSLLLRKLQERQVKLPMDSTTPEYQEMKRCLISPDLGPLFINAPAKFLETVSKSGPTNESEKTNGASPNSGDTAPKRPVQRTIDIVKDTLRLSKALNMEMVPLARKSASSTPITLFSKVGLGRLEMYVINPAEGCKELAYMNEKWGCNGKTNGAAAKTGLCDSTGHESDSSFANLSSICALLVWHPSNPHEKIVRVLLPGNAPQAKIFEGLESLKHLPFLKMQYVTKNVLSKQAKHTSKTNGTHVAQKPTRPINAANLTKKPANTTISKKGAAGSTASTKKDVLTSAKGNEKRPKAEKAAATKPKAAISSASSSGKSTMKERAQSKSAKTDPERSAKPATSTAKKPATSRPTSASTASKVEAKRPGATVPSKAGVKSKTPPAATTKVAEKAKKPQTLATSKQKSEPHKTTPKRSGKQPVKKGTPVGKQVEKSAKKEKVSSAKIAPTPPEDLTADFTKLEPAKEEPPSKPTELLSVGSEEPTTSVLTDRHSPEGEDGSTIQYAESPSLTQNEKVASEKDDMLPPPQEQEDTGFIIMNKPDIISEDSDMISTNGSSVAAQQQTPVEDVIPSEQEKNPDNLISSDKSTPEEAEGHDDQECEKAIKFSEPDSNPSHKPVERLPTPFHSLQDTSVTSETSPISESDNTSSAVAVPVHEQDKIETAILNDDDAEKLTDPIPVEEDIESNEFVGALPGDLQNVMPDDVIEEDVLEPVTKDITEPPKETGSEVHSSFNSSIEGSYELYPTGRSPPPASAQETIAETISDFKHDEPTDVADFHEHNTCMDTHPQQVEMSEDPTMSTEAPDARFSLSTTSTGSQFARIEPPFSSSEAAVTSVAKDPPAATQQDHVELQDRVEIIDQDEMPEVDQDVAQGVEKEIVEVECSEAEEDAVIENPAEDLDQQEDEVAATGVRVQQDGMDGDIRLEEDTAFASKVIEPEVVHSYPQQAWNSPDEQECEDNEGDEEDNEEDEKHQQKIAEEDILMAVEPDHYAIHQNNKQEEQVDLHHSDDCGIVDTACLLEDEIQVSGSPSPTELAGLAVESIQSTEQVKEEDQDEKLQMTGSLASSAQDQGPGDESEATAASETADVSEGDKGLKGDFVDEGPDLKEYENVDTGSIPKSDLVLSSVEANFNLHGAVTEQDLLDIEDEPEQKQSHDDSDGRAQPSDLWQQQDYVPVAAPRYHPAYINQSAPLADTEEVQSGIDQLKASELDSPLDVNAKPFIPKSSMPLDPSPTYGTEAQLTEGDAFAGNDELEAAAPLSPHGTNNPFLVDLMTDNQPNPFNMEDPCFPPSRGQDPCAAQDKTSKASVRKTGQTSAGKSVDSPIYLDLAYIPKHGNKDSAGKEFFKKIRAKYYVISGDDPSRDEPSAEVLDNLLDGRRSWFSEQTSATENDDTNVTVIPTHDSQTVREWYKKNFKELESCNIHMVASGSKVMVQVESIEACKIEF